ncbi:hypothetical protein ACJX0J_006051, partial [Zea mays]
MYISNHKNNLIIRFILNFVRYPPSRNIYLPVLCFFQQKYEDICTRVEFLFSIINQQERMGQEIKQSTVPMIFDLFLL